ncbi:PDR/VanB family oxidoreductase [Noviherbaspirillum sedimenti]|uniref:Oxidoreductase n=1 Tax=Noviherbaspirillum sedimenti TaxID=2320865 RepID=A0A3A3G7Q2_9BURK|nr:PDR/VanB family oxidoreductase [Noviherbaspirillum sedimenti]RJG04001.1 oxidoreductase [Noviherbaspirillum sedimenti]
MERIPVKVARMSLEATEIMGIELASLDGGSLPPFTAGSHIDVHLGEGLIRQYSLCNAPHETHRYVLGVLLAPASRGGSTAVHTKLREGDVLEISAPRNQFPLVTAAHSLLVAGGIGITPLLSMAEHLSKTRASFRMHYCARSPDRVAYRSRIACSSFAEKVHFHYDTGEDHQRMDLGEIFQANHVETHLYVCGPVGFIDYVIDTALKAEWDERCIHSELFQAAKLDKDDDAFEVEIASTRRIIPVAPGQSIADALLKCGIDVPMSCEQGICGTCLTKVISGIPDHRDTFLTDQERSANNQMTLCCSRSKSNRLTLAL